VSDRWLPAAAVSAWVGALFAPDLAWWIAPAAAAAFALFRRPLSVCLCLCLATGFLADRALDGLTPPPEAPFSGPVTLLTDPEPTVDGRLRMEVDSGGQRLLAEVRGRAADVLVRHLAGDRAQVAGSAATLDETAWTKSRHLAGRLRIESVSATGPGSATAELANGLRRALERGAGSLTARHRALLAGLVLGDDRAQPPELTADFRASGLTHLLAVSGQNVAFVLVVAGPVLRRLRLWPRFVCGVAVIAAFALVTRFEPSVLRAAFVAGVALFARTAGRDGGGVRHLSIAVCLLLLVDPLLVHSLGFRLSVAASWGVVVVAPAIVDRLPGPRWMREGLGVTAGAQLAVAPVLVPALGPMPLAALPANIVAGPVAGFLMVWGLTAGALAGALGPPVAGLLHLPSRAGLHLMEAIAAAGASLPLGRIDLRHVSLVVVAAAVLRLGRRRALSSPAVGRLARGGGGALLAAVVTSSVLTPVPLGERPAGVDATIWVDGPVAVVDAGPRASPVDVVEALRDHRVAAVGLVLLRSARPAALAVLDAVDRRFPVGGVMAPVRVVRSAIVPPPGLEARVGRLRVVVDSPGPPMRARIGWAGHDRRRDHGR
jgi:competence protein ComEC